MRKRRKTTAPAFVQNHFGGCSLSMKDLRLWMYLPHDLLHLVCSFLCRTSICRASLVCKHWRAAIRHEDFCKFLRFSNKNISVDQFDDICGRYPKATQVNIFGVPEVHLLAMKAIFSFKNLEALTLGKGQLSNSFFLALTECSMLKSLIISEATIGSGSGMDEITISHDSLNHIQIRKSIVNQISVRCPQLKRLCLKRSNMANLVLTCSLLHNLDMASCYRLSDAVIRSTLTSCISLESLTMSNCSRRIGETLAKMPMLKVLNLHGCDGLTSASISAISHCNTLEVLELVSCSDVTSVTLVLPRLLYIRLENCCDCLDLSLQAPALLSGKVSSCYILIHLNILSQSLERFMLHRQLGLRTISLQCTSLQEVHLSQSALISLPKSLPEIFSDNAQFPMVKTLVLDCCQFFELLGIRSFSLVELSLLSCRFLTAIEVICPSLEQVHLDDCCQLESASFCVVDLRSLNLGTCSKLKMLQLEAPSMVTLKLEPCMVSKGSISCPLLTKEGPCMLEKLNCSSCGKLEKVHIPRARFLQLLLLDLSQCRNLLDVYIACLNLRVLKLSYCCSLKVVKLECPKLTTLLLQSSGVDEEGVYAAASGCYMLKFLDISRCCKIHSVSRRKLCSMCPSLRRIFCRRLAS